MKTGWEMLTDAGIALGDIETICVRVNSDFGEIPVAQAEAWLSRVRWFTDHDDDGWEGHPTRTADEHYEFQIWTRDRLYRVREHEGIAELMSWPRTPEAWMLTTLRYEGGLTEIGSGRTWGWGKPEDSVTDRALGILNGIEGLPIEPGDEMPTDFTISWPLMPGDELLSREEIVLKYNLRHVIAHLKSNRVDEVTRLAGPDAWETISSWVDGVRAGR